MLDRRPARDILFGIGISLVVAPLTSTLMGSVPGRFSGLGSAINNAISRVGQPLLGAIIFIAISATFYSALATSAPDLDTGSAEVRSAFQPLNPPPADATAAQAAAATQASMDARNRLFGYSAAADRLAGEADRRDEAARRRHHRPGEHPDAWPVRRQRIRGAPVRVQGRPQRVSRLARGTSTGAAVRSLKDIIGFNDTHKDEELRYFGQEIMVMAEKEGPADGAQNTGRRWRGIIFSPGRRGIDAAMPRDKLDALVPRRAVRHG